MTHETRGGGSNAKAQPLPPQVTLAAWAAFLPLVILVLGWVFGSLAPASGGAQVSFLAIPLSILLELVALVLTIAAWKHATTSRSKWLVRASLAISSVFVAGCGSLFAVYMAGMAELQKVYDNGG